MKTLFEELKNKTTRLGVVGLGYVGLPLVHAFAHHFDVVGFDVNAEKVALMKQGIDPTGEVPEGGLKEVTIDFTTDPAKLSECRFIVVAVPTPVDRNKRPDLTPLVLSSTTVGKYMPRDCIVVYESTVYPGVTEDECVPLLEKHSGFEYPRDFRVGYSPERINPGDMVHRLQTITKVVSGCDTETLEIVAQVYETIIEAGVHRASSIKVAEAAKVIENTQRDVNIALMNELSIIFHKLGIDTLEVLRAAGTKWNFLKFFPGLVGGHCIGVDPYYLTFKAEELGYHPEVILSGRRINDNMGKYVAENTVKKMIKAGKAVKGAKVLILGLTFKEDVGDIRNTKVVDIVAELNDYQVETMIFDPYASPEEVRHEYGLEVLSALPDEGCVDAVILAVPHKKFEEMLSGEDAGGHMGPPLQRMLKRIVAFCKKGEEPILIDVKGFFEPEEAKKAGLRYWRL
ncbi:MAG: nucleotide sugar dehydrogenase [Candidatus Riflebacteria bacterium]